LQNIAILVTGVGLVTTALFQVSLSLSKYGQRRASKLQSAVDSSIKASPSSSALDVLRNGELYKIAFLYTFSRLFFVICIIYIPIWLNGFMKTKSDQSIENIALIPLIFFVASFIAAFLLKYINQKSISHKVRTARHKRAKSHRIIDARLIYRQLSDSPQIIYCAGSLISISGCVWITFSNSLKAIELFGVAILLGAGSSITQISSLCIASDLIGDKSKHAGLIYSIITVCDKLFSGIIIFVIEAL
jgi:hypothetical protein